MFVFWKILHRWSALGGFAWLWVILIGFVLLGLLRANYGLFCLVLNGYEWFWLIVAAFCMLEVVLAWLHVLCLMI